MMKKYVRYAVLLLLTVLWTTIGVWCFAQTQYPCYGTVMRNAVNVRKQASMSSESIGRLKSGEIVYVLNEDVSGWYEIRLRGKITGYVRSDLIKLAQVEPVSTATPVAVPTATPVPTATSVPVVQNEFASVQNTDASMQYVAEINEKQRIGLYTGTLQDGLPHGEGTFVTIDELTPLTYRGNWEKGEISGRGYVETEEYLLHLYNTENGDFDRNGSYYGEVLNGIPDGTGRFTTQNPQGITWSYDGEWKNGLEHGQGIQRWDNENQTEKRGLFENGDFVPTFVDILHSLETFENREFQLSRESEEFVARHEDTFFSSDRKGTVPYDLIRSDFNLNQFKKNPTKYDDRMIEVYWAKVAQVLTWTYEAHEYEMMILETDDGTLYYGFHNGNSEIVEDMQVIARILPLDYATYPNTQGTELWAVFCAIANDIREAYIPLYPGEKGDDVLKMKFRLQELGYFSAGAALSNAYNNTCVERVEQFQLYNDLPITGVADDQTLSVLYSGSAVRRPY